MKTTKKQTWVYNQDIDLEACGEGIARKILAYSEDLMCVENHFETGAAVSNEIPCFLWFFRFFSSSHSNFKLLHLF